MDNSLLKRVSEVVWQIPQTGKMKVPGIIYASEELIRDMDNKVCEQVINVAMLPGIQKVSFAMPDAHWGYGFAIGGELDADGESPAGEARRHRQRGQAGKVRADLVAAFDPDQGGVVSAGGVGFDVSCGVRTLLTGVTAPEIEGVKEQLADTLFRAIPAGVGSTGKLHLNPEEMEAMLTGGAQWAVEEGYGLHEDLERIEEHGQMKHAKPGEVSDQAKNGSSMKSAPLAREIITLRCKRWWRSTMRKLLPHLACVRETQFSAFTAARAVLAIKSVLSS